jgi:putative cell wall-binding protein
MRRLLCLGLLLALLGGCGGDGGSSVAAAVTAAPGTSRFAGSDDAATAALVSSAKAPTASDPILVRPDAIADGLAATYMAGTHSSTVLFVGKDEVPEVTKAELKRLQAYHVRVLGGTSVVSDHVVDQLKDLGMKQVDRVAGDDRYATAALGAGNVGSEAIGTYREKGRTAFLANGEAPWDALATGSLAYKQQWPVLLTQRDRLPDVTAAALRDLQVQHVIVAGGDAAVAPAVLEAVQALGISVERVAGEDRTATAVALASIGATLEFVPARPVVVGGAAASDAILAGVLAAPYSPVLLCAAPADCGPATLAWLRANAPAIQQVVVVGRPDQVSEQAKAAMDSAAQ